jgi:hypothetical protein
LELDRRFVRKHNVNLSNHLLIVGVDDAAFMKKTKLFAIAGFAIGIPSFASVLLLLAVHALFPTNSPATPDHTENFMSPLLGMAKISPVLCVVDIQPLERKLRLHHSFVLEASVSNHSFEPCEASVTASATAFDVKPEVQQIAIGSSKENPKLLYFSVLPNHPGEQSLIIKAEIKYGILGRSSVVSKTQFLHFNVYEYPYIPPAASAWFPSLASLFGGLLTIPYWIERRQKKQEKQAAAADRKEKEQANAEGDA